MKTHLPNNYSLPADENDPNRVMTDWVQAIDEFQQWYRQLNHCINCPDSLTANRASIGSTSELKQVEGDIIHYLVDFETEITSQADRQAAPLILFRLKQHTVTIRYLNTRMRRALGMCCLVQT